MVRILIGAIVGGVVMFGWGAAVHMLLPLGDSGFRQMHNEEAVLAPMKANLTEPGLYFIPGIDMSRALTKEEEAAWTAKYNAGPIGLLAYDPAGREALSARTLLNEFASNALGALLAAIILSVVRANYLVRVLVVTLIGAIAWVSIEVSLWNWYPFPADYVKATAIEHIVGWFLVALPLAAIVTGKRAGAAASS